MTSIKMLPLSVVTHARLQLRREGRYIDKERLEKDTEGVMMRLSLWGTNYDVTDQGGIRMPYYCLKRRRK